eukprot:1439419-Prymnesium_polylepis.1
MHNMCFLLVGVPISAAAAVGDVRLDERAYAFSKPGELARLDNPAFDYGQFSALLQASGLPANAFGINFSAAGLCSPAALRAAHEL